MKEFAKIIKDDDLELNQMEPTFENAKIIFDTINKNRDWLKFWFIGKGPKEAENVYNVLLRRARENNLLWGIFIDGKFVGQIGLTYISTKNRLADISFWLSEDMSGKGYVSRSVKLIENEIFGGEDSETFNKICIKCDYENKNSAAVAERNGYKLEMHAREEVLLDDGTFRDELMFSKLKKEWVS